VQYVALRCNGLQRIAGVCQGRCSVKLPLHQVDALTSRRFGAGEIEV